MFGFTDTNTDTDQGIFQLQILLLSHIRCHSKLGLLIRILVERLQLVIISLPKDPFTYSPNIFLSFAERSWITSTWKFIFSLQGAINLEDSWTIGPQ